MVAMGPSTAISCEGVESSMVSKSNTVMCVIFSFVCQVYISSLPIFPPSVHLPGGFDSVATQERGYPALWRGAFF